MEDEEDECYIVRDASNNGKNVTKQYDNHWDKFDRILQKMEKKLEKQNFQLKDDMDAKTALQKYGWNSDDSNIKQLVDWV